MSKSEMFQQLNISANDQHIERLRHAMNERRKARSDAEADLAQRLEALTQALRDFAEQTSGALSRSERCPTRQTAEVQKAVEHLARAAKELGQARAELEATARGAWRSSLWAALIGAVVAALGMAGWQVLAGLTYLLWGTP